MQRIVMAILVLVCVTAANAQMSDEKEKKGPGMMGGQGMDMTGKGTTGMPHQMPMMPQMGMPMMEKMMAQQTATRDMMYMMLELVKIEERTVEGIKPAERKRMLKDLAEIKERIQKMICCSTAATSSCAPREGMGQQKLKCDEQKFKKVGTAKEGSAIADPKAAEPEPQHVH